MKLSKHREKEIIQAYKVYFDSYINGDVKSIISLLDDDYNQIGSAETEVFFSKEDAIKFLHDTIDQVAGKTEMRDRIIKVDPLKDLILVTDLFDIYALMDSQWSFYAKLRASTLMQKNEDGWKFIHQHSSMPDTRTEEGDNIAIEKVNAENLQLREAVKRRTVELEAKNNELKIEGSLERIRAIAMSMQKAEGLLEVVEILYLELKTLGFTDIRNTIINIFNDAEEKFLNYDYSDYGVGGINEVDYNSHPSNIELVNKMREASNEFMITEFTGNELDEWRKWRIDQGQMPDAKLDQAESLYYYEYSIGVGTIGISTFSSINADQLKILNKIRNVFDLAYRRYADIEQAEAHAREAKIEAALERVRSIAMGMQKPHDLLDVCQIISKQLELLNINDIRNVQVAIIDELKKNYLNYQYFTAYSKQVFEETEYENNPESQAMVDEMQKSANSFYAGSIKGKALKEFIAWRKKYDQYPDPVMDKSSAIHYYFYSIGNGGLGLTTYEKISKSSIQIFKRFHNVFKLAYQRFIDIEKAEAQAREAQIEASLERVRAKSMAMHKSEDLSSTIATVFSELDELGFKTIRCGIGIFNDKSKKVNVWTASDDGKNKTAQLSGDEILEGHPLLDGIYDSYVNQRDYSYVLKGKDLKNYYKVAADSNLPVSGPKANMDNVAQYYHCIMFPAGGLFAFKDSSFTEEAKLLMKRFADVFHLTFIRHLDLMKAEAQAREAKIEAAMERVRAKSMAMHKSDQLPETAKVLFEQFELLGEIPDRIGIVIINNDSKEGEIWVTDQIGKQLNHSFKVSLKEVTTMAKLYKAWKEGKDSFVIDLSGQDLNDWLKYTIDDVKLPVDERQIKSRRVQQAAFFSQGMILLTSNEPVAHEIVQLLVRFAKVFDQAYTRFLDLQKAEAQVREAQIEAALERVRSKTMAMHNSEDMGNTVLTLFHEVLKLGLDNDIRCGIGILEGTERMETRSATLDSNGEVDLKMGMLDMTIHPMLKRIKKAWKSGGTHFIDQMSGQDVIRYYTALNNEPDYPFFVDLDTLPETEFHNSFSFSEGILFAFSPNLMSEEATKVLDRFARVFGQTYRRFRDLQKAEEQTREAKIEASLERIRSQAMAMQHSDDLVKSTAILFEEFEKLELSVDRCGIGIFDPETRDCQLYTTVTTYDGKTELATGITSLTVHPMLIKTFEAWESQQSLQYILKGKELEDYYALVSKSEFHLPSEAIENSASLPKEYYLYTPFGAGGLYVFSATEPAKEEKNIIRRFAEVFHLTYTRYEDLQKAEARALEAVKQASLDRVRGEIASMRTTEDLQRITPLIWKELNTLNVPFIRCGVFMIDESRSNVQVHLTTPDGKPIGALNLPIDANELTNNAVKHWRKNKVYTIHWNKEDFMHWMQSMISLGQVQTAEQYQGYSKPPESLDLHFIPFKQGMLYVGNIELLLPEKIELVETLAKAFSVAYSRYEDFVNLEDAKTRVEKTLSELKSAQSQLIHSEKMASLGELTAGIAHEIQNPLNFVNNFSEVSVDLIEEMDEEMAAGNNEEVTAIAEDLKQNLEKITAHGKRASFIVKGMLEHSRTNAGEKKPTNINVLADEFLRLAYHGLRAKDKSFNAEFITEFDDNLPKINVISQDFGRVLLNLINNAFYACAERSRSLASEASVRKDQIYKPIVTVSTKKSDDKVEIRVKDNGLGITENIKEKIFQPFFTTKPTGEGTGLGLSLSYDIITKGHGGELKVETKENEGTEFTILLPIN